MDKLEALKDEQRMTTLELAERWRVTPARIRKMARDGHLPYVRVGKGYLFPVSAVELREQWFGLTE